MLILACLVGAALLHLGHTKVPQVLPAIEQAQEIIFAVVGFVMRLAPIAVFGAMAVLIGQYGLGVIETYAKLIVLCYVAAALFIGLLAVALKAVTGLSLWKFLRYIREEMLLALGTASTESVMPRVMQKLRKAGARDDAVGLVLPTGYSFNLDGASLYLSIGTLFIAQAVGVDLSLSQQITVVLVLMLTSKGMAGIPGSAFLALSATASSLGAIPAGAVALLLGVDRIMDSMRVVTNLLGNCVAVFAVSRWEGALDIDRAKKVLGGETVEPVVEEQPAEVPAETAKEPAVSEAADRRSRTGRGHRSRVTERWPACSAVCVHQRVQEPAERPALRVRQGSEDLLRGRPAYGVQFLKNLHPVVGQLDADHPAIGRIGHSAHLAARFQPVDERGHRARHHLQPLREIGHTGWRLPVREGAQQPGLGRSHTETALMKLALLDAVHPAREPEQLLGEQAVGIGRVHAGTISGPRSL